MLREGSPIGAITVMRTAPGPFADTQIALLQMFADQAVIAIENVRLFTELQRKNAALTEALDQQTATSDILQVISSSPTDVEPIFDTILTNALRLCDGLYGGVFMVRDGLVHMSAQKNFSETGRRAFEARYPMRLDPDNMMAATLLSGQVFHSPDVLTDPRATEGGRVLARATGYHALLFVPLIRDGQPIGMIAVARAAAEPFSDTAIALLKTFADQAVIAIENVRLFTELGARNREVTEALEQQTATSDILRVISSSPTDVKPVFDTIVQNAVRLCDGIYGQVFQFDGELIHLVAQTIDVEDDAEEWRRAFPRPLATGGGIARVITTGVALRFADVEPDPDAVFSSWAHARMREAGTRSLVLVPMLRRGLVIGVIVVTHRNVAAFADAVVRDYEK